MRDEVSARIEGMSDARSLICLEEVRDLPRPVVDARPEAPFLTQLLASARRFGAYRRHRRGEPDAAAALYLGVDAEPLARGSFQRQF